MTALPCFASLPLLAVATSMLVVVGVRGKAIHSFAGPFTVNAKRYYMCDTEAPRLMVWYVRSTHFNPAKPNEKQRLTGNLTFLTPFGDHLWAKVVMDSRSNNQWKENAFVFKFMNGACTAGKTHNPDTFRVFSCGTTKCPIPKNTTCVFTNQPISWDFPNFPVMPYGEWRFRVHMGQKDKAAAHGCFVVELATVPKIV